MRAENEVLYQDEHHVEEGETLTVELEPAARPVGRAMRPDDVARIVRAARTRAPAAGSWWSKNALWFVPAIFVFIGTLIGTLVPLFDDTDPDVDCVAYVRSLTELAASFPDVDIDSAQLADAYGEHVVDECGPPAAFLAAVDG